MKSNYQVYGVSFLDLLSGALGAVIILFVIVPKMDVNIPLEEIHQIKEDKKLLDSLYASIQGNIPEEQFNMLLAISQVSEARIDAINTKHEELQRQFIKAQDQAQTLREKLAEKEAEIRRLKSQRSSSERPTSQRSQQPDRPAPQQPQSSGQTNFFAGIDCELAVFLEWESDDFDVDLYFMRDNQFCDEQYKRTDFCTFVKVPRKFKSKPSELIIQPELVPGTYELYAHLYRPRDGKVKVKGFIGMNPKEGAAQKHDFAEREISHTDPPNKSGGGVHLGTLTVKENKFQFQPKS